MLKGLMGATIWSEDLNNLLAFYRDVLGLKVAYETPGFVGFGERADRGGYTGAYLGLGTHTEVKGKPSDPHRHMVGLDSDDVDADFERLTAAGVEFIEQPLPADRAEYMKRVGAESVLPIIADENCIAEADVAKCHQACFRGINIKLSKCGGLTPARRMIAEARRLGLSVMVGCMTESSVGISAIAQLLPLLDYVDMDGAVLLAQDIADGVRLDRGRCIYPSVPGNGVTLHAPGRDPLE